MLHDLRLRLTSTMLGDVRVDKTFRFKRSDSEGWLAVDLHVWKWSVGEAWNALGRGPVADVGALRLPTKFELPTLTSFRKPRQGGKLGYDFFEAINRNSVLSFEITIPERSEHEHKRPPNVEETRELFSYIGEHLGLSPWGSKYGYGRFRVESLEPVSGAVALHRIKNRCVKIPLDFYDKHRERADEILFLGHPLTSLGRNELLAIAASFLQPPDDSPDSR